MNAENTSYAKLQAYKYSEMVQMAHKMQCYTQNYFYY